MTLMRGLLSALPLAGLIGGAACAPLPMRPQSPHAVGVQFLSGAGGPHCEAPEGVEFDPARVCASQFDLDNEAGIGGSYGHRAWGVANEEGPNFRLGPEVVVAWISKRALSSPLPQSPDGVSSSFVAALLRMDVYREGPVDRPRDIFFNRLNASIGGGLAVGRFRESDALLDGTANANRRTDVVVGPVVNFGLGYWITKDVILRGDLYGTFIKPELSFPWSRYASFAGIGVVKIF